MQLANQQAQKYNHEYIGTEHILLGLLKEISGVASRVFEATKITAASVQTAIEKHMKPGPDMVTMGKLPQTPRAKKCLEYAIEEAKQFGHGYVGTEHILLGLLRDVEGLASQAMHECGLEIVTARKAVVDILGINEPTVHDERTTLVLNALDEMQRTINRLRAEVLPKPNDKIVVHTMVIETNAELAK